MKYTEYYGLNLMEAADILSARPLNENADKIDAALKDLANTVSGKLMMAAGRYTGSGTRTVTIQTPGFTPQIVLMHRRASMITSRTTDRMEVEGGWCLWLGEDMPASYEVNIYPTAGEGYTQTEVDTTICFSAVQGSLTWSIDPLPESYSGMVIEQGAHVVNNASGAVYEWIAFGVAG